jgi:hypothetical protein
MALVKRFLVSKSRIFQILVFSVVTSCGLVGRYLWLEEHAGTNFRFEGLIPNDSEATVIAKLKSDSVIQAKCREFGQSEPFSQSESSSLSESVSQNQSGSRRAAKSGFGPQVKKIFSGPQASRNRLYREDWLAVAECLGLDLKRFIFTIDKQWCHRERQKHMKHNRAPDPFPDCRAPVICTGLPQSRRHWSVAARQSGILSFKLYWTFRNTQNTYANLVYSGRN